MYNKAPQVDGEKLALSQLDARLTEVLRESSVLLKMDPARLQQEMRTVFEGALNKLIHIPLTTVPSILVPPDALEVSAHSRAEKGNKKMAIIPRTAYVEEVLRGLGIDLTTCEGVTGALVQRNV